MRALTYNLLAGQGDDALRLSAAASLLRAARLDVLVLNECTALALDDGAPLRELEALLGMHATLGGRVAGTMSRCSCVQRSSSRSK